MLLKGHRWATGSIHLWRGLRPSIGGSRYTLPCGPFQPTHPCVGVQPYRSFRFCSLRDRASPSLTKEAWLFDPVFFAPSALVLLLRLRQTLPAALRLSWQIQIGRSQSSESDDLGCSFPSETVGRRDAATEPPRVRQAFLEASASCAGERHQSVIGGWDGFTACHRREVPTLVSTTPSR